MNVKELSQFDFLFIQSLMGFIANTVLISKNPNSVLDCEADSLVYELNEYQELVTRLAEIGEIEISLKDFKDLTKSLLISVENLIF